MGQWRARRVVPAAPARNAHAIWPSETMGTRCVGREAGSVRNKITLPESFGRCPQHKALRPLAPVASIIRKHSAARQDSAFCLVAAVAAERRLGRGALDDLEDC
jgi:hypothetical protein